MQAATQNKPTHLPPGFRSITPYMIVREAGALIEFFKQAFGIEDLTQHPAPGGGIMHAELRIGDTMIEMADGGGMFPAMPSAYHLYVPDADAVYQKALEAGATSLFTPADREYGDRETAILDPSGNQWYIATHKLRPGHYRPEQLSDLTLYLHPKDAAGFIGFLQSAFGAEERFRHPNPDGSIAHATLAIGSGSLEMGEAHKQWQPMPASIHLYVTDTDATYAQALEAGATSIHPVKDQPYGERSGGVQDAWGNKWWIATYTGKIQP